MGELTNKRPVEGIGSKNLGCEQKLLQSSNIVDQSDNDNDSDDKGL